MSDQLRNTIAPISFNNLANQIGSYRKACSAEQTASKYFFFFFLTDYIGHKERL